MMVLHNDDTDTTTQRLSTCSEPLLSDNNMVINDDNASSSTIVDDNNDSVANDDTNDSLLLLDRGAFLRALREMEIQDEAERMATASSSSSSSSDDDDNNDNEDDVIDHEVVETTTTTTTAVSLKSTTCASSLLFYQLSNGKKVLYYNKYLKKQKYYDDVKHIDYKYIDYTNTFFGTTTTASNNNTTTQLPPTLIIEQDKTLGKGGFCWDAAYILADYLIQNLKQQQQVENHNNDNNIIPSSSSMTGNSSNSSNTKKSIIELGTGTGLAGIMIAKALIQDNVNVMITDLPPLVSLAQRNINLNFDNCYFNKSCDDDDDDNNNIALEEYYNKMNYNTNNNEKSGIITNITASTLDWSDNDGIEKLCTCTKFDIIIGADVVASLYDPIALANTIYKLCNPSTIVYIAFKLRLLEYHEKFENAMKELFGSVEIIKCNDNNNEKYLSRNRNPDVYILIAKHKKLFNYSVLNDNNYNSNIDTNITTIINNTTLITPTPTSATTNALSGVVAENVVLGSSNVIPVTTVSDDTTHSIMIQNQIITTLLPPTTLSQ